MPKRAIFVLSRLVLLLAISLVIHNNINILLHNIARHEGYVALPLLLPHIRHAIAGFTPLLMSFTRMAIYHFARHASRHTYIVTLSGITLVT